MNNKVSDNHQLDFPARMSDGRQFTDFRSNCYMNNLLGQRMGSWEYRTYLTRNANDVHNQLLKEIQNETACTSCSGAEIPDVKTVVDCTQQNTCYYSIKDNQGLGQGRKY
tara:strand:- start:473 stop:802 length:330 start_codon:yes stop_codon:yes gene_type:complete